MSNEEVKVEQGGVLDNVDVNSLRNQAQEVTNTPAEKKEDNSIFDFGDAEPKAAAPETNTTAGQAVQSSIPTPTVSAPETVAHREPTKEELGGGIIIENKPENKGPQGPVVGPLAPGSETSKNVEETMKNYDDLIKVGKMVAAAKGQKGTPENTVVEILMDKTGMTKVEFSDEERQKMQIAKKIKVVEITTEEVKGVKLAKPKAARTKHIIAKAFDKQYAPFVAAASGYLGKMRNMSSLEVINLVTISNSSKNTADAIQQKASLIYSKLKESSVGDFPTFDDFAKKTAMVDLSVMLYALVRATYPEDEEILMNCANAKCTHKETDKETGRMVSVPNQFTHKYKNTEILLTHKIPDVVKNETERIFEASHTVEEAIKAEETAPINQVHRFALGEDQGILVDIYCPSVYDMVENIAKKIDVSEYRDMEAYAVALNLSTFIKAIHIKDEDSEDCEYNTFDDIRNIVEIVYNMGEGMLELVQQLIETNVLDYKFKYGFKADTVVCPLCGQAFTEDVEIEIENLLFLQAQRHMTNG